MNANLTREYYVRHDGGFDDFVAQLNCFQAALYFLLKAKTGMERTYELFTQDPSYSVQLDGDGRFLDAALIESWRCFEVFQTHDVKGQGAATMAEIEAMLDEGEIVLFETFLNRVPHMKDFVAVDLPYEPDKHNMSYNHIFVGLAHTDTHLYYAESPVLLTANHVPYNGSPCVGMIEKSVLRRATDCFLNYRRVEIKQEGLRQNRELRVAAAIRSMLDNAVRPAKESAEGWTFYGTAALDKLAECCGQGGAFMMNRLSTRYHSREGQVLEWKFSTIRQQKTMLYRCIERNPAMFGEQAAALLEASKASTDAWQLALSKLRLMLLKKQEDMTAFQGMLRKMKECDLRFEELAERWYAHEGASLETAGSRKYL